MVDTEADFSSVTRRSRQALGVISHEQAEVTVKQTRQCRMQGWMPGSARLTHHLRLCATGRIGATKSATATGSAKAISTIQLFKNLGGTPLILKKVAH